MENPSAPQDASAAPQTDSPALIEGLLRFEPKPLRLGEVMVELGMVSAADVARALDVQSRDARLLGEVLVDLGACSLAQVTRALEAQAVLTSPLWRNLGSFRWKEGLGITRVNEIHRQAVVLSIGERHVQLSPEEFTLAEGLVEEHSFGAIARRCWERTEQLVWPEQLLALTTRLWALGMIAMEKASDAPKPEKAPPQAGGWARWVQLRFPLHDPSRMLDQTARLGRFLFSRPGLVTMTLLVALASGVLSARGSALWTLIVGNVTHQWVGGVGSFVAAMLISSIVHEYGHAMACRAFGGQVRRMGIMIYVLAPMAFCDVSDAHRFADKRHRMVVGAGGIYVQLGFAALCAIAWAWAPLPPVVSLILAQFVAVTLVSTLVNLNPLLKLDGYYILADWLEIPNLRSRAFAMIDSMVRRNAAAPEGTPRERKAFLWYGILGGAYTVAIAGYMTWMLVHLLLRALALE